MLISGIEKASLVDWHGKVVTTLFTPGCNFRCGWCHNKDLVLDSIATSISRDLLDSLLKKNRKWIDGVCITGGEPLLQDDIPDFLEHLRESGFLVKLDTNGYRFEMFSELIGRKAVDYVAFDIKGPINSGYSRIVGRDIDPDMIKKSAALLMDSGIDYEFRTTAVPGLISEDDIADICGDIRGARRYYIQRFRPVNTLDESFTAVKPYPDGVLGKMAERASGLVEKVYIR
ncbi:MAG: anaerobic ribonucleoside-triphosphate reductase activating protein [Elusimicrobia bacterium]|nr:anaerobic ribonucleoside-triphosphate reductase activating protein [Elusimicrobiota bacterium]